MADPGRRCLTPPVWDKEPETVASTKSIDEQFKDAYKNKFKRAFDSGKVKVEVLDTSSVARLLQNTQNRIEAGADVKSAVDGAVGALGKRQRVEVDKV